MDKKKITDVINLINRQKNPQIKKNINYFDFVFIFECYFLDHFASSPISNAVSKKMYIDNYTENDYIENADSTYSDLSELEIEIAFDIFNNYKNYMEKYYKYRELTLGEVIDLLVDVGERQHLKSELHRENYIENL